MKIKVSAPGKLMLLGEHSVVYGHPCLVTAVDKRMYVSIEQIAEPHDQFYAPQVKDTSFVEQTVKKFKAKCNVSGSIRLETQSDFSDRLGLGSSAACTVATVKALSEVFQKSFSKKELFDLAFEIAQSVEGTKSGFDIASAIWGGTLFFVTGGKTIEPLSVKELPMVIAYSGVKASTRVLVSQVKELYQTRTSEIESIFEKISQLVLETKETLLHGDFKQSGVSMTQNHQLLKKLGVSTPKLDSMVDAALTAGAWGAKLSGAGGGDCIIIMAASEVRLRVVESVQKAGGEIITVAANTAGVRVEK